MRSRSVGESSELGAAATTGMSTASSAARERAET